MDSSDLTQRPKTDPTEIYRLRDGLYAVDLVGAAVSGLDFFSWLAKQPSGIATICQALQLKERPTDVMLTLFTSLGLLEKRDGVFHPTEMACEFLVKGSPWFMGAYY